MHIGMAKLCLSLRRSIPSIGVIGKGDVLLVDSIIFCQSFCQCDGVGDVYAAPAPGGLEVRFALDFRYCALIRRQITALAAIGPGEAPESAGEQPSLVLRMLGQGERLWDMAKAYGTTIADIISANELEGEAAAEGRLLLIPRRR